MAPLRRAGLVPLVDGLDADPEAERPLQLPALVEQLGEGVEVAGAGDRLAHLVGQVAHRPEDGHLVGGPARLLLEDLVGAPGLAGVEQERPPLQLLQGLGPARDRLGVDGVVGVEPEVIQAAEGRGVLVLAADRLLEDVDLDLAGLLGQLLVADRPAPGRRRGR